MSNISKISGNSLSPIGDAPLRARAGSSFSRPAALIGGATALIALTAIATTLVVKSPEPEASMAGAAAAVVAAQSLTAAPSADKAEVKADVKAEGKAQSKAPADKSAPVRAAKSTAAQLQARHATAAAAPAPCATCGVIESVTPFQKKGEGTGIGAVGGAVVGGILGHQVGGGDGKKAMTVIGAVGGGVAGNEIERRHRATTLYSVKVRMDDGSQRTLTQSTPPTVGQKVTVEGAQLRSRA